MLVPKLLIYELENVYWKHPYTFYDAALIAISEKYKTKLITADDRLYKKVPKISILILKHKRNRNNMPF